MSNLNSQHPLRHNGTTQIARLVRALRTDTFRLDERTQQDLIVAAYRYAQTLRFFDETDTQPSDLHDNKLYWEGFWEVEKLTYLAVVAATDTDEIRRQYEATEASFLQQQKSDQPFGSKKIKSNAGPAAYRPLVEELRLLAWSLESAYEKLVRIGHPLQTLLLNRIKRDNCCDIEELQGALKQLIAFHKGADQNLQRDLYKDFFHADNRWGVTGRVDYDAIAANPGISLEELQTLFGTFYDTWIVLKSAAQSGFDAELALIELPEDVEYRIVQPHIVLFLVFLRLFKHAQDSMNDLADRHLSFYYEAVLGLHRRNEIPDEAYLLFELAKDVHVHLLEKGTEFLAGKDQNGKPLLFEAIEDTVLNAAKVADIKNTYFDEVSGSFYANPNVKKLYGDHLEKPNETAFSWRGMGDDTSLPYGEIGFAIASPQLILREGKRIIDVKLNIDSLPANLSWLAEEGYFKAYLSSGDKWIELEYSPTLITGPNTVPDLTRGSFNVFFEMPVIHFRIVLERDDRPVVQLGPKLSATDGFSSDWPILKIVIDPTLPGPDQNPVAVYEAIRTLIVTTVTIKVDARGIRENLIIQSDQGVFDGTQKIFPFGPIPEEGNRFYIGSTEVFQKALNSLDVTFTWIDPPKKGFDDYYKEYKTAGIGVPNPSVLIDFIDRATESVPQKITRTGKIGTDNVVNGTVTDINGKPVGDAKVEAKGKDGNGTIIVFATTQTDANGKYTVNLGNPNSGIATQLKFSKDPEDFEPNDDIDILGALTINVVLYPRKAKIIGTSDNTVTGKVTDVYGQLLNDVTIETAVSGGPTTTSGSTGTPDSRGDNYQISSLVSSDQLKFSLTVGSTSYEGPGNIPVKGFAIIDAVLFPVQKKVSATNTFNGVVKGNITQSKNGDAAETATIVAETTGASVVVKMTSTNGSYKIPMPTGATKLSFLNHKGYGATNGALELLSADFKADIDVEIFANPDVSKNGKLVKDIVGVIQTIDGTTPDASIVNLNSGNNVNTDSTGHFVIQKVAEGDTLKISQAGYQDLLILVDPLFAKIDATLAKNLLNIAEIQTTANTAPAKTIQLDFVGLDGLPLNISKIITDDGSNPIEIEFNPPVNTYVLNTLANDSWDIVAYSEHVVSSKKTVNEKDKSKILVAKHVVQFTALPAIVIKGKVIDVNGHKIAGAAIAGTAVKTDENGRFEYTGPTSFPFNLTFQHGAFDPLTISVDDNSELEITLLPKKAYYIVKGQITDIFNVHLNGAVYSLNKGDSGISAKTGADGLYEIPIPLGMLPNAKLNFNYGTSFESLEYDLDTKPATFSEMDVRLYFINLNSFKLIDGNIRTDFSVNINALNLSRDIRTQQFTKYSPTLKRGFIRFTLNDDTFFHKEYPKVLTWFTLKAADPTKLTFLPTPGATEVAPIPNPPYTPATNGISLNYTSEQVITGDANQKIDQFYQLLPFKGYKSIPLDQEDPKILWIYPFKPFDDASDPDPDHYASGNLFIGLSDLIPGGSLSLLVQVDDGTEIDPEILAPTIEWSYLAKNNEWLPFPLGKILRDTTNGLTRSGMIQFGIPTTAVKENTLLDPDYFWLRAAVLEDTDHSVKALPSIISIDAQAIQARFKNQHNELSHLAAPLPAETISKLAFSRSAVKKIDQPLESFDGKLPETANLDFYYRVSERLRHKDRAVTVWDFEHLLLEHFNTIAAAKCIPHTRYKPASVASELAPGYVTVSVIPELRKHKNSPWPEPRFTKGNLDDIRAYLLKRTNLFVAYSNDDDLHLQLVNPLYEKIDVQISVIFKPEILDTAFFTDQLKTEITNYISPWLVDPANPPMFGRILQRSKILQFVEERPYVDYVYVDGGDVSNSLYAFLIRMIAVDVAGNYVVQADKKYKVRTIDEQICPGTARSILVAGNIAVNESLPDVPTPPKPIGNKAAVRKSLHKPAHSKSTSSKPAAARIVEPKSGNSTPAVASVSTKSTSKTSKTAGKQKK